MSAASQLLEPIRAKLVRVPAAQPGICPVCRTAVNEGYPGCHGCVGAGETEVLPITMSIGLGIIHHHLRGYKDGPNETARRQLTIRLAALVRLFFRHHAGCVGEFDDVATVPSARRDAPRQILNLLPEFRKHEPGLLEITTTSHSQVRRTVTRDVAGMRILVIDDTFTTGASIFATARAITDAGGTVVGPVVIGRHVNPEYPPSKPMLEALTAVPFDLSKCARCDGAIIDPPLRTGLF